MKHSAIYCRTSTEAFASDLSIQKESCLKFAKAHGLSIPEGFVFLETASAHSDRQEFDKLRELAKRGEIASIVTTSPDRIARDENSYLEIQNELHKAGVALVFSKSKLG